MSAGPRSYESTTRGRESTAATRRGRASAQAHSAPAAAAFEPERLEDLLASLPALAAEAVDAETRLRERVALLKDRRATWAEIGAALHVTRQAAWERFGPRARRPGEGVA
jgi:hypothetical protein